MILQGISGRYKIFQRAYYSINMSIVTMNFYVVIKKFLSTFGRLKSLQWPSLGTIKFA